MAPPAVRLHGGRLAGHQPGDAQGERPQVNQLPVVRNTGTDAGYIDYPSLDAPAA